MYGLIPSRRRGNVVDVFRGMDELFKRAWRDFPFMDYPFDETSTEVKFDWTPRIDISERGEAITVKAELPGLETKDLDISLEGDVLTIKGEKKHEKEEAGENYRRVERCFGSFHRVIRLPADVKKDKIDATFKNGVLKIVLAKTDEAKRQITHVKVH